MRLIFISLLILMSFVSLANYQPQNGDIIFQSSKSSQSKAIEQATQSPYSHMGIIIIKNDNKPYVFEASSKVIYTPLNTWIARGVSKDYV